MSRAIITSLISSSLMSPLVLPAQDTSSIQGFEAAFRRANTSKDFRRLEQLVCWERATLKARQATRDVLRQEFGHPIRRIETRPFSRAQEIYPPRNRNLRPTHSFTVWSVTGRDRLGTQMTGTFYTLGKKHSRFYLIISDQPPIMATYYE